MNDEIKTDRGAFEQTIIDLARARDKGEPLVHFWRKHVNVLSAVKREFRISMTRLAELLAEGGITGPGGKPYNEDVLSKRLSEARTFCRRMGGPSEPRLAEVVEVAKFAAREEAATLLRAASALTGGEPMTLFARLAALAAATPAERTFPLKPSAAPALDAIRDQLDQSAKPPADSPWAPNTSAPKIDLSGINKLRDRPAAPPSAPGIDSINPQDFFKPTRPVPTEPKKEEETK